MFRLSVVVAFMLAGVIASPARACTPPRANAAVRVSFLADSDLTGLVKWARQTLCVDYAFESSLADRRLAQAVILTVTGHDASTVFELLLHTMNLKVHGHGQSRTIVADGPETAESREANERDKAESERNKVLANLDAEIRRKDENHYTITRRGADAIMSSLPNLARTLRVTSEAKDGKPVGFRLLGLRPGAPLSRVGLQNGDVVHALNGVALTSPGKALEAYASFRRTDAIAADCSRGDRPFTVELRVER